MPATSMRAALLVGLLLVPLVAKADVTEEPIHSNIDLKPGATRTFTFESAGALELGWKATQAAPCTTDCIRVTDAAPAHNTFATKLGGAMKYEPVDGKITLTYANESKYQLVTITIYRVKRTCDAASCAFVKGKEEGRPINIVVGAFKSIATSKDGSYSEITGETATGKHFTAKLLWWTDDPNSPVIINCSKTIQQYIVKKTPPEDYSPYILPGTLVGDGSDLIVMKLTGCVAKGTNYGMSESSIYK
jgi:hypothetical protein